MLHVVMHIYFKNNLSVDSLHIPTIQYLFIRFCKEYFFNSFYFSKMQLIICNVKSVTMK